MIRSTLKRWSKGYSFCQLMVVIGVVVILLGTVFRGAIWLKRQAELVTLAARAQHFGTALQLYYQKHKTFPSAYPAHLDQDLAPYVDGADFFTSPANPTARAAPLNNSYVTPVLSDPNSYVLGFDSSYDEQTAVVLFSNATVEVVEKLSVRHNSNEMALGSCASGGTITFANGSTIELGDGTSATVAHSFRASDGTPFHIIKTDQGEPGTITGTALGTDIIEIATAPGLVFLRGGVVDAQVSTNDGKDQLTVSTLSGQVRVIGMRVVREQPDTGEQGGASGVGQILAGRVNLNQNNSPTFQLFLKKADGGMITRDDLRASNRQLEYTGPVMWVYLKPKGTGSQNSLVLDGATYPLSNDTSYLIVGDNMTLQLYNDAKLKKGNAMGHWWLDSISATSASIYEGLSADDIPDVLPPQDDPGDAETDDGADDDGTPPGGGRTVRTLCRGISVLRGRAVTVEMRR